MASILTLQTMAAKRTHRLRSGASAQETDMFKDNTIFATFAVRDTAAAKTFYGDTVGLDVRDGQESGLLEIHGTGGTPVTVYPKPDHQPATFTVLNIVVTDIEAAVDGLIAAGVSMEHYD